MDLSIVIVNYKSSDVLAKCLESIFASVTTVSYEVTVVDNGSRDAGLPAVKNGHPGVRFIDLPENRGFAAGSNVGIRAATGKAVLLLNPDAVLSKDTLEVLYGRLLSERAIGIVGPRVHYADGSLQTKHIPKKIPTLFDFFCDMFYLNKFFPSHPVINGYYGADFDYGKERQVGVVGGACLMIKKEAIDAAGLMDERFFLYFEEMDWCARVLQKGYRALYIPSTAIRHHLGKSAGQNRSRRMAHFYRSELYFTRKHHGVRAAVALYALNVAGLCLRFFAAPFYVLKYGNLDKVTENAWGLIYHLDPFHFKEAVAA